MTATMVAHRLYGQEVTFEDIYRSIQDKYRYMKDIEIAFERRVLRPNNEMKDIYDYAVQLGKRIIIVSDMYFSQEFLDKLLVDKGYSGFKKVYVSSEYRKKKWNGELFDEVLDSESIAPGTILHIGDDRIADVLRAHQKGLAAVLYQRRIDQLLQTDSRARQLYKMHKDELGVSILLGLIAIQNKHHSYWENLGYTYAGPAIFGFMSWLKTQLISDEINTVLFIARDGYMLQRVFDSIPPFFTTSHYVFLPRKTGIILNFDYNHYTERGAVVLFNYFQSKHPFLTQHTPANVTRDQAIRFLQDHSALYLSLVQKEQQLYKDYLYSLIGNASAIAVVDTGSTALSAQRAIKACLPELTVSGYYWFVWKSSNRKTNTLTTFSTSVKPKYKNWVFLEFLMSAPTPPIDRVENGSPIFQKASSAEQRRIALYPSISSGAEEFAQLCIELFGACPLYFTENVLKDWINLFITSPTETDIREFRTIMHAHDPEHSHFDYLMKDWYK